MAVKSVGYKEPAAYFNQSMQKAAEKWEKENAKKQTGTQTKTTKKK